MGAGAISSWPSGRRAVRAAQVSSSRRLRTVSRTSSLTSRTTSRTESDSSLLRWQALSGRHKPLIVFTPKSMLRLKAATSAVADFTGGFFQPLIGEAADFDGSAVRRVVLCAGKVYYDLAGR